MPVRFFKKDVCRKQTKTDIKQHKKCVKAVISNEIPLFLMKKRNDMFVKMVFNVINVRI